MKKYIKASDGSMVSFATKTKKTFKPVTASRYGQAPKTVDKYQYHVYCDRGSGMELSAWYDTYEEAKKTAIFLKKKGYDVEIRDTFQESVNAATAPKISQGLANTRQHRYCLRRIEDYYGPEFGLRPDQYAEAVNAWIKVLKYEDDILYDLIDYWGADEYTLAEAYDAGELDDESYEALRSYKYPEGYAEEAIRSIQGSVNATTNIFSGTYVIVKPSAGRGEPGLFIDSKAIKFSPTQKAYSPNFTSTRANNINRAKKFNSAEEAQAFIDKQANDKDLWKYAPVEVMSFDEAMNLIGDPDENYKAYKQNQADKRAESRKRYAETAKSQSKKNREKNPGTYKVTFWYSDKSLGNESYIVDAESIDDAFQKAKAKALQQDAYRNQDGYDQKMTFNKQNIRKIEGAEVDIEHNDFDVPVI